MELWISSQDSKTLLIPHRIEIINDEKTTITNFAIGEIKIETTNPGKWLILVNDKVMGEYKTEQRALDVLYEIKMYLDNTKERIWKNGCCIDKGNIYEMPGE